MKFEVGDLVRLASAVDDNHHKSAALVIAAYKGTPTIFLHNKEANRRWLEDEDIETAWIYDIIYDGCIEVAVSGEWLAPCKKKGEALTPPPASTSPSLIES